MLNKLLINIFKMLIENLNYISASPFYKQLLNEISQDKIES